MQMVFEIALSASRSQFISPSVHLRLQAVLHRARPDVLAGNRNKHAAGQGCRHHARQEVAQVDFDFLDHFLRRLELCALWTRGDSRCKSFLVGIAAFNAAQNVMYHISRNVHCLAASTRTIIYNVFSSPIKRV